MAFDGNGQAFQDLKLQIAQWATDVALIATLRTARQNWTATWGESTGYLPAHEPMGAQGNPTFSDNGVQSRIATAASVGRGTWLQFIRAYINANGTNPISSSDPGTILRILIAEMINDTESIDASVPTIGSVSYGQDNQGDGTATIILNTNATLKELALAGKAVLICDAPSSSAGAFAVQNVEPWKLTYELTDPQTGNLITRTSPSIRFVSNTQYEDVIYTVGGREINGYERGLVDLGAQVPQVGAAIMTGLVCNIATPDFSLTGTEGTDADGAFASYFVNKKVGTKSNLTRRNTTYAYHATDPNGKIYLHVVWDGTNAVCTWRIGSGATSIALTESKVFTAATTGTQSWLAAATNPEAQELGGFLVSGVDTFISAVVTGASFATSNVVDVAFPLPWARGDRIMATVSNAYAGVVGRYFVNVNGIALPANTGGTETITDP